VRILWTILTTPAGMSDVGLDAVALYADRINEAVSPSTLASIRQIQDNADLGTHRRSLSPVGDHRRAEPSQLQR
jgi:hypothetical protein